MVADCLVTPPAALRAISPQQISQGPLQVFVTETALPTSQVLETFVPINCFQWDWRCHKRPPLLLFQLWCKWRTTTTTSQSRFSSRLPVALVTTLRVGIPEAATHFDPECPLKTAFGFGFGLPQ
eukprot:INCI9382.3.p1 GENE.INCI9382.3~~INCI9382.3.p1  ORF type:complete len:124 (+),score=14.56 INCI9382.3:424-795(+)